MPGETDPAGARKARRLILLMAATAGFVVANNYYNQPLLGELAREFAVSPTTIAWIATLTQLGYAVGLLLLLPLCDMLDRRRLILRMLLLSAVALVLFAFAPTVGTLALTGFLVGLFSMVPQTLPPFARRIAPEGEAGRAVGTVLGGLLLGILLSRAVGGVVGEMLGWQAVYLMAAGVMLLLFAALRRALPTMPPTFEGTYGALMRSIVRLVREQPVLRLVSLAAALQFGAFLLFWTTLVFHLEAMPGHYSAAVAGLFGLVGAVGVLAAPMAGRLADRVSPGRVLLASGALMVAAFAVMPLGTEQVLWLVPAVILLDLGMQICHVTSMSIILGLDGAAANRANTVYMVTRFLGAAAGTFVGALVFARGGWLFVCAGGAAMTFAALAIFAGLGSRLAPPAVASGAR